MTTAAESVVAELDPTPPPWAASTDDWSHRDPGEVIHLGEPKTLTAPDGVQVLSINLSQFLEVGYECPVEVTATGRDSSSFPVTRAPEFAASLRGFADTVDAEHAKALGLPADGIITPIDRTAAIKRLAWDAFMEAAAADASPLPVVHKMLAADEILTAVVETSAEVTVVCDQAEGIKPRPASDEFFNAAVHLVGETFRQTLAEAAAVGDDQAATVERTRRALRTLVDLSAEQALRGPDGAADG